MSISYDRIEYDCVDVIVLMMVDAVQVWLIVIKLVRSSVSI